MLDFFTPENTDGYTQPELDRLNAYTAQRIVAHLSGSIYDENDVLAVDQWYQDAPDDYKNTVEQAQQGFDTQQGAIHDL